MRLETSREFGTSDTERPCAGEASTGNIIARHTQDGDEKVLKESYVL